MSKIVFCDFDGTITAVETFAGMLNTPIFSPMPKASQFAPD